jgi:hypothetical protein
MTDYKALYDECRSRREQDRERITDLNMRLREANARADACLADVLGRWELAQKLEQAEAALAAERAGTERLIEWMVTQHDYDEHLVRDMAARPAPEEEA